MVQKSLADLAGHLASFRSAEIDRLQVALDGARAEQWEAQDEVRRIERQSIFFGLGVASLVGRRPSQMSFRSREEHEAQQVAYQAALARRDAADAQFDKAAAALNEAFRQLDEDTGGALTAAIGALRAELRKGIESGRWVQKADEETSA
jgi:hypothetical protein